MSNLDDREQQFETRFTHEQELAFKAEARRVKLFGLWAAHHLGLAGDAAEAYAAALVAADFHKKSHDGVLDQVAQDFAAKAVPIDRPRMVDEFQRLAAEALKQIRGS